MSESLPKLTWPRALRVSLAAVLAMWAAAWVWSSVRELLVGRGIVLPDLVFLLGLVVVVVVAAHLVAGGLLRDIRRQIEAKGRKEQA